jgi:hypothetical protein
MHVRLRVQGSTRARTNSANPLKYCKVTERVNIDIIVIITPKDLVSQISSAQKFLIWDRLLQIEMNIDHLSKAQLAIEFPSPPVLFRVFILLIHITRRLGVQGNYIAPPGSPSLLVVGWQKATQPRFRFVDMVLSWMKMKRRTVYSLPPSPSTDFAICKGWSGPGRRCSSQPRGTRERKFGASGNQACEQDKDQGSINAHFVPHQPVERELGKIG